VLAQFFGHLPFILAFHRRQQTLQEATCPQACLGSTKARPNACLHLSQFCCCSL
jgi:hypothetical protein